MVTIKTNKSAKNQPVKLVNGTLLLHLSTTGAVLHKCLAIPFRNNKGNECWNNTANYCSLLDLETGKILFEEPCSRNTDFFRILRHLNRSISYGDDAVTQHIFNQTLAIHDLTSYDLEIVIKEEQ